MTVIAERAKVARIREEGYPIGRPAPTYLNCPCGAKPRTNGISQVTCTCGTRYSGCGWILASPSLSVEG
jgi:hypothetical protein